MESQKYKTFADYPTPTKANLWLAYAKDTSEFKIWAPTAEKVILRLYKSRNNSKAHASHEMQVEDKDLWKIKIDDNLNGTYNTYQVKTKRPWLNETQGIYAKAVGVNGERAMILDMEHTNSRQ